MSRGFSAYVDAAVQRQIERDLLEEALQVNEEAAGPISPALRHEVAELYHEVQRAPELRQGNGRYEHEAD